ncbi:hypothetical protein VIBNISFn118_1470004 [Vibrio nigripulchritudo SFn118]|nr:hypothetical protein VIBNISFn118_1470004 [Vibrio nigripulchritudo SFn118]
MSWKPLLPQRLSTLTVVTGLPYNLATYVLHPNWVAESLF